jgi:ABC-type sulfate transport system substrate-binding protein
MMCDCQPASLHRYFKPKSVSITARWTEKEEQALIAGIEKFGVGDWSSIAKEFFSREWVCAQISSKHNN